MFQPWKARLESHSLRAFRVYGVPLVAVAAAISFDRLVEPIFHRNPFLFFYGAVMVSAWCGGFAGGLFCTLISALAVDHLILPFHQLGLQIDDIAEIVLFVTVGLVTSGLSQSMHSTQARLEARLRQQAALAELGRNQSAGEPLQQLLEKATRSVADVLRVDYCKILELTHDKRELVLRAGVGWKPGFLGNATVSALDGSQAAFTLRSNGVVILRDVRTEGRFTAPPLLSEHQIVSGISISIIGSSGTPWGVLGAHSERPHAFTDYDKDFVQAVANLVAMWVQNAQKAQQLVESEARFRTLAESLPQMSWSVKPDGSVDYISKSWCEFTGLTMEQSLGYEGWQKVLHPDDAEWVLARWQECISKGTPYDVECRLRTAAGDYRWVLTRGTPMRDADGNIQKWFGTCTDVHAQRLAEEALRDREKLKATGRLAMTAAHEINNPLASITNLVYLAKGGLRTSDPRCTDYLEQADRELQRLSYMVSQTLGFYKDSSIPAPTDPVAIVQELLSVYKQKINAKQLKIQPQFRTVEPLVVSSGDLRQVIAHVLLNAIHSSPVNGTIQLRIYSRPSWSAPHRYGIHITVADTGSGITRENRKRIFQPFFSTKREIGTGLGLWTAKGILKRYDGSIRFRTSTRPGKSGTVFTMFFPSTDTMMETRMGKRAAG